MVAPFFLIYLYNKINKYSLQKKACGTILDLEDPHNKQAIGIIVKKCVIRSLKNL